MKRKARSALLSVFPSREAFDAFAGGKENEKIITALIAFAYKNGLIKTASESDLKRFIRQNATSKTESSIPKGMTLEDFFEQKETLLNLSLSFRALTKRINGLIEEYGLELPKVTNSMLTRLKREPADTRHKQNALRSLAFWIGHERSDLPFQWDFEVLLSLCRSDRNQTQFTEGVRIGFALHSRGDVIDHDIVRWLKTELKTYIKNGADKFPVGQWGKVRSHGMTTVYVDFPKESAASNPVSYRQSIRKAVSVAHQMAVRWALSEYGTKNRFLSIGIAAGDYGIIDNYLLPILNAKLPDDPVIRMTDYARQCLLINDIRAILCTHPKEITLFTGEPLSIWWVVGLWSSIYYDFIPDLLADPILQNHPGAIERLNRLLMNSDQGLQESAKEGMPNAVTRFIKFPHNSLLGIEIAKTLYYRRRFWEAMEILRIVLSIDPVHLNARTLRMAILRNLAVDASSRTIAMGLFQRAETEAEYILECYAVQAEDFYCEYGVVFLARGMMTLRYLRQGGGRESTSHDRERLKKEVFSDLKKAGDLFQKGMTVSPSAIRSAYLFNSAKVLHGILQREADAFHNASKSIDSAEEIVKQPSFEFQWQIGYYRDDLPAEIRYDVMESILLNTSRIHDDSISLQTYRPTTHFCTAVAWWDFFPKRTVTVARRSIQLLSDAARMAQAAEKEGLCIYSYTRTYGEMLPAREFVRHMRRSIRLIETAAGDDLENRDDRELLTSCGPNSSLLLTLNFE